jgi:hypothetical protein
MGKYRLQAECQFVVTSIIFQDRGVFGAILIRNTIRAIDLRLDEAFENAAVRWSFCALMC